MNEKKQKRKKKNGIDVNRPSVETLRASRKTQCVKMPEKTKKQNSTRVLTGGSLS
jgi:hypothetical protein